MSIEQGVGLVLPLRDAASLEQVGGKGASLARLLAAGLSVPPGFTVATAAYRRFVAENGLQQRILAAAAGANPDSAASLDEASISIMRLFAQAHMPEDIAAAIRQMYAALGRAILADGGEETAVAVRSSATAEDLPDLSFAGQQETYLNVRGAADVLAAVKRCWASLWTARAIGYRARHGIAPEDVSLAVVVQELVDADASGILFTANPLTGARDQVVINAAWGLGEAIVGGQVTPDTLVVATGSGKIVEQHISAKDVMTVRTAAGTREEPVPEGRRHLPALTQAQAVELAHLGERIERLYGQPMDVEWALAGGQISVVQARPITALPDVTAPAPKTPRPEATQAAVWHLPNPKGRYARSSVFELLPDPLSPLFATLGLPAWSRSFTALMRSVGIRTEFPYETLVTINGYGYYDLSFTPVQTAKLLIVMPRLLAMIPRLMFRTSVPRWRDARSRYEQGVRRWQTANLAATSAGDLLHGVREITDEAADYYLTIQGGILPAAYLSEAFFTLVYNRFVKRPADPAVLTYVLGFDSEPLRAEQSLYDLGQWVRTEPELAAQLTRMSGEQFATAYREPTPKTRTGAWLEFRRRLEAHLAHFGHAIYDLDFAKPVLAENPAPLLETLKFFMSASTPNPAARQSAARTARERATRRMLTQLHGPRRAVFCHLVELAQRFAPLREDALADVGLGWPVLRRMLRELGQRLVTAGAISTPDDVYWLTLDELEANGQSLDAGQPLANAAALVGERRAAWERERALTPPSALPPKEGARFLGIDFSSMMPAHTGQPAGDVLKGIAASPGRVTGPARVIGGPHEFDQMRLGEILVARITTPAWTPLFALAVGVVTDVGGPLSHSSIVAREYHIPAVLGTGEATARLRSGQRITVDGDAGTVTLSRP